MMARGPSAAAIKLVSRALRLRQTWEVSTWESAHWVSCHVGKCTLGKLTLGKIPLGSCRLAGKMPLE